MFTKKTARRAAVAFAATILASATLAVSQRPAAAIPIFAQRYGFSCKQCHSVLPELNAFGNAFRNNGYHLPIPKHATTIAAIRYNLEYVNDPAPGSRRFTPSASIVSAAEIGRISAFLHYNLGAGGSPSAPYLGFLAYHNDHTGELYRLGLYELPLTHSPGQRLDEGVAYGYESLTVGQNDLALNAPRLGFETERTVGFTRLSGTVAFGEFKGAAYGGAPVSDGTHTVASRPEIGLFALGPLVRGLSVSAEALDGARSIELPGHSPAQDEYERFGFGLHATFLKDRLLADAEQWLGRDNNADARGGALDSSGGYARLKYFVTPHFYLGARYDAQAAPFPARDAVFYVGTFVTPHARIVLQQENNLLGGKPSLGGEFITAFPWGRGE
ncbi:MAG: hypothetical protein ACREM2_10160 [Vulcanimicrobiaceae bacterium]